MKGFLPGPYEHRPSLDELAQFMTGLAYMTGPPGQPLRAGTSVIDIMGGVMGALAVLAALRQRDKDGIGRKVTSSLYESSAFLVGQHMAGEAATGTAPPPMPARKGAWGIYETFDTRGGEKLFIGITSDNHWRSFCRMFDRPDLLADPRFTTNGDRVEHRDALRVHVAEIARAHDIDELSRLMDQANIPFAPVRRPSDLFDDPQLNAFGRMLPIRMPNGDTAKLPPLPVCFDDVTPGAAAAAAHRRRAHRCDPARAGLRRCPHRDAARGEGHQLERLKIGYQPGHSDSHTAATARVSRGGPTTTPAIHIDPQPNPDAKQPARR